MSLAAFQRALTDFTASPAWCREVMADPALLTGRYDLTAEEAGRLTAIVASKGMEANCMLYRANRLAPVALNCPDLCAALGDDLNRLISAYWDSEPTTNVHFLVETERFCSYLAARDDLSRAARTALAREHARVRERLAASAARSGEDAFAGGRSTLLV
ncbi:MAG: hypothetical protein JSS55_02805 [Proteobacteria bacterium]|nr:hypothetical protein [Pseudomonadota bacterium]